MARHRLQRLTGMIDSNTTILKARHGDRNGMVNACKFLAKTGRSARPCHALGQADWIIAELIKCQAISDDTKNSEEQRKTARRAAVFSTR
jgi:hypothetical protein